MRDRPPVRWALIPSLGAAGFLAGAISPVLYYWLNWHAENWRSLVHLHTTAFAAGFMGLACAIVGAGLAFLPWWVAAVAAPFVVAIAFPIANASGPHGQFIYCWGEGAEALLAGIATLGLTLLLSGLVALHDRRKLGVAGPYAAVAAGAIAGMAIYVLMDGYKSAAFLAIGALLGLTQYYAVFSALKFHDRRERAG